MGWEQRVKDDDDGGVTCDYWIAPDQASGQKKGNGNSRGSIFDAHCCILLSHPRPRQRACSSATSVCTRSLGQTQRSERRSSRRHSVGQLRQAGQRITSSQWAQAGTATIGEHLVVRLHLCLHGAGRAAWPFLSEAGRPVRLSRHVSTFAPRTRSTTCLHYFDEPVSPHLAAELAREKDGSVSHVEYRRHRRRGAYPPAHWQLSGPKSVHPTIRRARQRRHCPLRRKHSRRAVSNRESKSLCRDCRRCVAPGEPEGGHELY